MLGRRDPYHHGILRNPEFRRETAVDCYITIPLLENEKMTLAEIAEQPWDGHYTGEKPAEDELKARINLLVESGELIDNGDGSYTHAAHQEAQANLRANTRAKSGD